MLTDYKIEVSSNCSTYTAIPHTPSISLGFNVSGLQAGTEYCFRVSAVNGLGTGAPSSVVRVTTLATVPSAPTALTTANVTDTTVTLRWTAPTDTGGSPLIDYRVEVTRTSGKVWTEVPHTASTSRSITVSNLYSGTTYQVRVSAKNGVGYSDYLTGEFKTAAGVPSPPTNLTASSLQAASVRLNWRLPARNGGSGITDYKIEVSSNGGATWTAIRHRASTRLGFDVTNLKRATNYQFRVSAVNDVGTSTPSTVLTLTTPTAVPSAPTSLTTSEVTDTSVILRWAAPSDTGGSPLTDYRVEVSRTNGRIWTEVPHTASTSRSMTLSNLYSGTTYQVRVSAKNDVGFSDYLTGEFKTAAGVPMAPADLTASNLQESSVRLNWRLPARNGGSGITDYQVEVASDCSRYTAIPRDRSTALGFNVTGLTPNTNYCFRVSAINAVGLSSASTVLTITTPASTATLASTPTPASTPLADPTPTPLSGPMSTPTPTPPPTPTPTPTPTPPPLTGPTSDAPGPTSDAPGPTSDAPGPTSDAPGPTPTQTSTPPPTPPAGDILG